MNHLFAAITVLCLFPPSRRSTEIRCCQRWSAYWRVNICADSGHVCWRWGGGCLGHQCWR